MNNNKGFISISIIYSFFIVFLLIMLSMLADYLNKRYLLDNIIDLPKDGLSCTGDDMLSTCLFKNEYNAYLKYPANDFYKKYANVDLMNDDILTEIKSRISEKEVNFSSCSTTAEGLYTAKDDFGDSYYYRGDVDNNYVKFAGYMWRIVRINGDTDSNGNPSIRLILYDNPNIGGNGSHYCEVNNNRCIINTSCIGLMNNCKKRLINIYFIYFDDIYGNSNTSEILNKLYSFYDNGTIKDYKEYLNPKSIFCADKNVLGKYSNEQGEMAEIVCEENGYGESDKLLESFINKICENNGIFSKNSYYKLKYFRSFIRVYDSAPSLICNITSQESAAKFDSHKVLNLSSYNTINYGYDIYANNNKNEVIGNGKLSKAIGLISADEVMMSGGSFSDSDRNDCKSSTYSINYSKKVPNYDNKGYWTGSTGFIDSSGFSYDDAFKKYIYNNTIQSKTIYYLMVDEKDNIKLAPAHEHFYVRPVINIKDVSFQGGNGTFNNPYIIGD